MCAAPIRAREKSLFLVIIMQIKKPHKHKSVYEYKYHTARLACACAQRAVERIWYNYTRMANFRKDVLYAQNFVLCTF